MAEALTAGAVRRVVESESGSENGRAGAGVCVIECEGAGVEAH